jgi:transcriptional regulator with XRE-family HTH domain
MTDLPDFERVAHRAIAAPGRDQAPIRTWREYRQLSPQALAAALRLSVAELTTLENTPASELDPDILRRAAARLAIEIGDLIIRSRPWVIRRQGRAWQDDESLQRYRGLPEDKPELWDGKVYWSEEARLYWLACLLEQCGADAAVRLGDPAVWREALAARLREIER